MSKITIEPNQSGTGVFTLASPNSNTDRTLTLPDQSGEVVTTDASGQSLALPIGTTAQRPASPQDGYTRYNTTIGGLEIYSSSDWKPLFTQKDFAQFANTASHNIVSGSTIQFNTVLHASGITHNFTNNTWQHSQTGFYKLIHCNRQITDVWSMSYVVSDVNGTVGNSIRSGSVIGGPGFAELSMIYEVQSTSENFELKHWLEQSNWTHSTHAGSNPTSSQFVTPQVGTAPTTGYYQSIIIEKVS
jgi:hypothetical protein